MPLSLSPLFQPPCHCPLISWCMQLLHIHLLHPSSFISTSFPSVSPYLPHPTPRPINLTILLFLPFSLSLSVCAWLSARCLSHKHEKQTKKLQLVWNPKAHLLTRVYQQVVLHTHAASEATCYKELKLCLLFAHGKTLGTYTSLKSVCLVLFNFYHLVFDTFPMVEHPMELHLIYLKK